MSYEVLVGSGGAEVESFMEYDTVSGDARISNKSMMKSKIEILTRLRKNPTKTSLTSKLQSVKKF